LTGNNQDAKHFISGKNLGEVKYFLALDNAFFNQMKNQGKIFLEAIELVKPVDLLQVIEQNFASDCSNKL